MSLRAKRDNRMLYRAVRPMCNCFVPEINSGQAVPPHNDITNMKSNGSISQKNI